MEPGTDDESQIEAWLEPAGDRTRLVVEERGLRFDELRLHGAGWQAHLEDFARSLSDEPASWRERWEELTPAYQAMPIRGVVAGAFAPPAEPGEQTTWQEQAAERNA